MTELSPLFSTTCKVLRDVSIQELRTQNSFLRKQLETKKDLLLHLDVIITEHIDFATEHKEMKGIYIGKGEHGRCNILVRIDRQQYMIKQIIIEKIIFLKSKNEYNQFVKMK